MLFVYKFTDTSVVYHTYVFPRSFPHMCDLALSECQREKYINLKTVSQLIKFVLSLCKSK